MSLTKRTARRLSLMAGSSLVAGLSTIASFCALAIPTAVQAQVTCVATPAPAGNGTNAATIAAGTYNPGIACTYTGTTSAVTTGGAIAVSSTAGGTGIDLTATGASAINWTSTAGTVTGGANTNGPVISATSANGNIDITTAGVTGSAATITHGIFAAASGAGNVTINTGGTVSATNATGDGLTPGGRAAIEASSGSGDVTVNYGGNAQGRLYGIVASVSGDANLTINATSASSRTASANSTTGVAGIYASTGAGLLTITGAQSAPGIVNREHDRRGVLGSGGAGTGVLIDAGGDVDFMGGGTGAQYGIRVMDVAQGTTTTLDITNSLSGGVAAIRAAGEGELIVNMMFRGTSNLNFDFTGMSDPVEVTFTGQEDNPRRGGYWQITASSSTVPDGNFNVTIGDRGGLVAGSGLTGLANTDAIEAPTVVTFAAPDAVLTVAEGGVVLIGPNSNTQPWNAARHEAELRLVGLSEFRHAGLIVLGEEYTNNIRSNFDGNEFDNTDGVADDIFSVPGALWVGQGGEILYDININRSQTDCTRDPVTGNMGAADCVMIQGGATEGVTYLTLIDEFPGDRGRLNPDGILLVDVSGGTSAQGHFVVGPNTPEYSPQFGGSIDKGTFQYVLAYNEDTQQHVLYGIPSGNLNQIARMGTSAQALWRVSTGTWLERQADLRNDLVDGIGGGVWLRASGEIADREVIDVASAGGQDFAFDNTYEQKTYAVTGGLDLMSGSEGDTAYVVGLMAGYANTKLAYDASPNQQQMDGFTGGAYASFISGGLFVDAAVNANKLVMDNDTPGFGFSPDTAILTSNLLTVGAQVEAGWRLPFAQGLFVEPLASAAYARTTFDDFEIENDDAARPGLEVSYDDPASLRLGLGGRVGLDQDLGVVRAQISLLGNVWNEMEGENAVIIKNTAFPTDPDLVVTDDFSGQFTELGLGASVWSAGGLVSGFLNLSGKFGDDYDSQNLAAGVRVNW